MEGPVRVARRVFFAPERAKYMTHRIFGRVAFFVENTMELDIPLIVYATPETPRLPYHPTVEVVLSDVLLPSLEVQQAWTDAEQFVVIELDQLPQIVWEEGEQVVSCQALMLRPMTDEEIALM